MISSFRLKAGRSPTQAGEEISTTQVTVFVGPNNSGKSKVLSEFLQFCHSGNNSSGVVCAETKFFGLSEREANDAIAAITVPGEQLRFQTQISIKVGQQAAVIEKPRLLRCFLQPSVEFPIFGRFYLAPRTLMLSGDTRIRLVDQQAGGDLLAPAENTFQILFRDDKKRREVRRILYDAFGIYFVIDPSASGTFRIRFSKIPPESDTQERGLHDAALKFHSQATLINSFSDGVKAFTGIITAIIAGDPKVILIDEPEAFLHPSLAAKLGNEVCRAASSTDKRLIVSTHSPSFLMGCIQSGVPVNIIRLTYRNDVGTSRLLPSHQLVELMRNPLLRSSNVLGGLFYESVVVTESDADRAFYQEINERLLRFRPEWGIPNCLFINAQNKQTVPTLVRPLRKLGIPTAGIVDVDFVKDGAKPLGKFLDGINIPELSHRALQEARASIHLAMEKTGKEMKSHGGLEILQKTDQEAATNFFKQLGEYGLFVVPGGELESWLKKLDVKGHSPHWLISVFERMGEDPDSATYVRPEDNDVWKFMAQVKDWLTDPSRKGIPD